MRHRVPELRRHVLAAGQHRPAVRTVDHGVDRPLVLHRREQGFARGHFPELGTPCSIPVSRVCPSGLKATDQTRSARTSGARVGRPGRRSRARPPGGPSRWRTSVRPRDSQAEDRADGPEEVGGRTAGVVAHERTRPSLPPTAVRNESPRGGRNATAVTQPLCSQASPPGWAGPSARHGPRSPGRGSRRSAGRAERRDHHFLRMGQRRPSGSPVAASQSETRSQLTVHAYRPSGLKATALTASG